MSRDAYQNKVCHKALHERRWRQDKATIEKAALVKNTSFFIIIIQAVFLAANVLFLAPSGSSKLEQLREFLYGYCCRR